MKQLTLLATKTLPEMMKLIYPLLESACAYSVGKYNALDIIHEINMGRMQIWGVFDTDETRLNGIALTEIVSYPQRKICRFLCCTGENAKDWLDFITDIEKWAVSFGCDGFQAECRPGWERLLKPHGYVKTHVILNKDIE